MDGFHGTPPGDLGVLALGLVIAGAVGGLIAGVLGIGGGIVLVPVLFHVMATLGIDPSVRMHIAIGTSLAATLPATLARARSSRNDIDWKVVRSWTIPTILGVVPGSVIAALAAERVLATVFAVVALPVTVWLAVAGRTSDATARLSAHGFVLPAMTGFASAMTGMGGDAPGVMVLQRLGLPENRAAATASMIAIAVALPGAFAAVLLGWNAPALPPASFGYFNLIAFALTAAVLLPAEAAGAALAHMIDLRRLRLVFAALVAIATARMLWDAWM